MDTAIYNERKFYTKYDDTHYMLYLREETATLPERVEHATEGGRDERDAAASAGQPVEGWSYTGPMPDGGTLIEAAGVTDANRRKRFIAGLIATRYSIDDQIAVLANGSEGEDRRSQFDEFERFRTECKAQVDLLLAR